MRYKNDKVNYYLCTMVKVPIDLGSFEILIMALGIGSCIGCGIGSSSLLSIASSGGDINGATSSTFGISKIDIQKRNES